MSVEFVDPPLEMTSPISDYIATDAEYRALRDALRAKPATGGLQVVINTYGEGLPYLQLGEVLSLIAAGAVWVDYCGWPMWGMPAGQPTTLAGSNKPYYQSFAKDPRRFSEFLRSIGKPLTALPYDAAGVIFDPHDIMYLDRRWSYAEYPWARGMVADTNITNSGFYVPDPSTNIPVGHKTVSAYSGGQLVSMTLHCYSCFGVRYQNGAYFYAYRGNPAGWNFRGLEGVAPQIYADAIATGLQQLGITASGGGGTLPPPWPAPVTYSAPNCPVLQSGSSGEVVRALQQALNLLQDAGLPVTGNYGSLTTEAVRRFQQQAGVTVDGVVGCQTYGALDRALRNRNLGYWSCGNCGQTQPAPPPPPGGGGGEGGGTVPTPGPGGLPYLQLAGVAVLALSGGYLLMRGLQRE